MAGARTAAGLFRFDRERAGGGELAGADEAGRGCLAGPLVAAAVVFDYRLLDSGRYQPLMDRLDDSKRLTAGARETLFPLIIAAASRFTVVAASSSTIDEEGLHRTNLRLLEASLERLAPCPALALVDGYALPPDSPVAHEPLTKGDSTSACVAAASVLAKVSRDRMMRVLHGSYPQYGFERHVGYATRAHRQAIARHGLSPQHRRSFSMGPLPEPPEGREGR